jgi:hypothetical protein
MNILNLALPIYLIIAGLYLCGAALPRWVLVVGGVAGIIAGVLLLVGLG